MQRLVAACLLVVVFAAGCGDGGGSGEDGSTDESAPLITSGSGGALPVTYVGPDGVETRVADASRIVSLSGEFSEIIWELGLGDRLVGVDLSSVYPPEEMAAITKVGVERLLFAELILSTEPTVVVGDVDATPVEAIDQVRGTGVPVVILPRYQGVDAPAEKIRVVGEVLGVPDRAAELADRVQGEIDEVVARAAAAEDRPRVAVVYAANRGETLLLLGDNTVMEGLIEAAGGVDVAPEAGADGMLALTPEALAGGAPDIIVTASRTFDTLGGLEGFLELPGVAQTPAGRNRRVLVYEDLFLLGLGPRTGRLLERFYLDFHPESAS